MLLISTADSSLVDILREYETIRIWLNVYMSLLTTRKRGVVVWTPWNYQRRIKTYVFVAIDNRRSFTAWREINLLAEDNGGVKVMLNLRHLFGFAFVKQQLVIFFNWYVKISKSQDHLSESYQLQLDCYYLLKLPLQKSNIPEHEFLHTYIHSCLKNCGWSFWIRAA